MSKLFSPLSLAPVAGIALLALSGCVVIDADETQLGSDWDHGHEYGVLKGADVSADTVTVRVSSNGCTAKDFIGADVRRLDEDRFSVGFYRQKQDYCRAHMPDGVALTWGFAELGIPAGAEVKIRNPVGS